MSAIYRAKAEEYEGLAATVEQPFKDALLDIASKWRTMSEEADAEHNPNRAFAERLRFRLGWVPAATRQTLAPNNEAPRVIRDRQGTTLKTSEDARRNVLAKQRPRRGLVVGSGLPLK